MLAAGVTGALLGALHAGICSLPRVNDIAVGIALMLFGTGLAFYLGKPLIEPTAARLPAIDFGWWSDTPQVRAALQINVLFLIGVALAPILYWAFRTTRWGLLIRTAGESADAARAMGYFVLAIRLRATMVGGFLAGIGGSFLSLFYPGSWNEGLSSGQGITAVALLIFARWEPMLCLWASLAFGGAAALGPALQSVGVTSGYHLFNAAPYILTLAIMIVTCSPKRTLTGAPAELSKMGYDLSLTRAPIAPIKKLLAVMRAQGFPSSTPARAIFLTSAIFPPTSSGGRGRSGAGIGDSGPCGRVRGEPGWEIIDDLAPLPGEPIIDKPGKGAFYATELENILTQHGIENLLVCGVTTEVCVNTTVREANDRGYRCVVLADRCASYFPEFHEMGLKMIKAQGGIFGWVSSSAAVLVAMAK